MFTQKCIIRKNTPKLREQLKNLGCKLGALIDSNNRQYGILYNGIAAIGIPKDCDDFQLESYLQNNPDILDCGMDENLFINTITSKMNKI